MKKSVIAFLCAFILTLSIALPVSASDRVVDSGSFTSEFITPDYVYEPVVSGKDSSYYEEYTSSVNEEFYKKYLIDEPKLLTEEQAADIENKLELISNNIGCDVVVLIENNITSDLMAYADDFYDYNGYSDDGVLLLINTVNGEWTAGNCWISTKGYAITAFTDSGIQYIGKQITPDLESGDYYAAINTFADMADDYFKQAESGKPFEYNQKNWLLIIGVTLSVAIIGAVFITSILKAQLKSVEEASNANNYLVNGSLKINQSYDTFIYKNVVKVKKEKQSSSGGSSTHRSSSGSRHGGGGF